MSGSRAVDVSLYKLLLTAISKLPESTVKALKKDTNNLAGPNKKIGSITHPVTKRKLKNEDRIHFIANQCREAFKTSLSGSKSSSKSSSKSKSDDEDSPYKNLKLPLDFEDIDKILEYPTKTTAVKEKHLMSLFKKTKNLTITQATELLKKYLEDPAITDSNVLLYRKIEDDIRKYVPIYNPFMQAATFNKYVKNTYFEKTGYSPATEVILKKASTLFNEAIFYSDNNKTADDFKRNLKENYYKYYGIEFMLLQLKKLYRYRHISKQAQLYLRLIDKLIEDTINITDSDASISFEKSPDWSASPVNPILKAEYKTNKKTELAKIMDVRKEYAGSINDADFYTMEEWKDMSLKKLKSVIVIPYKENGKIYANAYYVKSLYKAWYMAVKDRQPFLNPANRKEFKPEDKAKILEVIQDLYPGLKEPRYGTTGGRSDITVSYTNNYHTTNFIKIHYRYSCEENYFCRHLLLKIEFPSSFGYTDDNSPDNEYSVPLAYNPTFLFDMINTLMRQNKIISKKVPFKIAEPFKELSNLDRIITKTEYMRFFDKLRLML